MTEGAISDAIRLALSDAGIVAWRNNVGVATMPNGSVVRFGVGGNGGSDLIGLHAGRFLAIEVKTPHGKVTEEQARFGALVERYGGVFVVLRSVEQAREWASGL